MSTSPLRPGRAGCRLDRNLPQSLVERAMQRHGLTDREWARLEPLLPPRPRTGRPPKDHRPILDALLWLGKTGRAVARPAGALRPVADRCDPVLPLDPVGAVGAHPRRAAAHGRREGRDRLGGAHGRRHERAGAPLRRRRKRGRLRQALGRSRGGFGSKLHLRCDRRGRPMAFVLTPGERNEKAALPRADAQGRREAPWPWPAQAPATDDRGRQGLHGAARAGLPPTARHQRRHPPAQTERTPRLMEGLYRERNVVAAGRG